MNSSLAPCGKQREPELVEVRDPVGAGTSERVRGNKKLSLINVKNAIKTYITGDTSFRALDDVSLSIKDGEFVAIMGASGSGKSTFMNMLGCLDKPTSGSYFLDGIDVMKLNSDELSDIRNLKLGFVFQGFNLISRTSALENVEMPMIYKGIEHKERIVRAKEALKIVGLRIRKPSSKSNVRRAAAKSCYCASYS